MPPHLANTNRKLQGTNNFWGRDRRMSAGIIKEIRELPSGKKCHSDQWTSLWLFDASKCALKPGERNIQSLGSLRIDS
jgi:hypothetical protein